MKSKRVKILLILLLALGITATLNAQRQTGSIFGKVIEVEGSPLPGASVTLSGPSLMGIMTYTTTEGGDFRFPAVPPGNDYVITAEMPGFKIVKRSGIIVNVGKTFSIIIQLEPAELKEEVTVTAPSPTVDVTSTKITVSYSDEILRNIPAKRDYFNIIITAPGVINAEDYDEYRTFSSHGSTVRSNTVAFDGVYTMTPDLGVHLIQYSYDVFDEVEMELGAHPAEVGMTDGAYVNIVTKSGGNEFHGQATAYFFNDSMVQGLIPEKKVAAVGLRRSVGYKSFGDYSFSLGGPIIKDKLWFFINGRYNGWNREFENYEDIFDVKHEGIQTFAKFTLSLNKNIKFVGMWSFGLVNEPLYSIGLNYYTGKSTLPKFDNAPNHTILGQINWIVGQNTFFDMRLNYLKYIWVYRAQEEYLLETPQYNDLFLGTSSGGAWYEGNMPSKRFLLLINATHFLDNFLGGNHELKLGAEYESSQSGSDLWKENPYTIFTYNGQPWGLMNVAPYMGMFMLYNIPRNRVDNFTPAYIRRFSAYFQDSFTIKNRLTLNLGLRYDESHGDIKTAAFDLGRSNDPILSMLAPQLYATSYPPFEANNVVVWKNLSPRLGAVFDVFGDGRTSLKASWSRYNNYLISMYFVPASPNWMDYFMSLWFDFNMNGIIEPSDGFLPNHIAIAPDQWIVEEKVDPNMKSPYTDELIIGIESELFKDFSVGISYIYKKMQRLVDDTEIFRGYTADSEWWIPYTITEPGWDGQYGTSDDKEITVYGVKRGAPPSKLWTTNPEGAERKYRALEFIFNKRMSNRWQFLASLVLSKFEGNVGAKYWPTGAMDVSFNTPNWFVNRYGRLDLDRPVQIKLQGSVLLPYDFMLSAYYSHFSGTPWTRTLEIQLPFDSAFEYAGTFVETVNAEAPGENREQSRNNLDIRVEKMFNLGNVGRLGIFLDVENVFGENWFDINLDQGGFVYNDGSFQRYPTYGQFTQANGMRIFKLSARFTF